MFYITRSKRSHLAFIFNGINRLRYVFALVKTTIYRIHLIKWRPRITPHPIGWMRRLFETRYNLASIPSREYRLALSEKVRDWNLKHLPVLHTIYRWLITIVVEISAALDLRRHREHQKFDNAAFNQINTVNYIQIGCFILELRNYAYIIHVAFFKLLTFPWLCPMSIYLGRSRSHTQFHLSWGKRPVTTRNIKTNYRSIPNYWQSQTLFHLGELHHMLL